MGCQDSTSEIDALPYSPLTEYGGANLTTDELRSSTPIYENLRDLRQNTQFFTPRANLLIKSRDTLEEKLKLLMLEGSLSSDPQTYEEAMASQNKADWSLACHEEKLALIKNNSYEIEKQPAENTPILSTKWVFKTKR